MSEPGTKTAKGPDVYVLIRRAITSGRYMPGQRLSERELAARYSVSRTPIREATFKLEQEGLITKLSRGGFRVPEFSAKDIEEIFNLRGILEGYAAGIVIDRITPDHICALEDNVEKSKRALANNRLEDLIALNTEFHDILIGACDSKFLLDLVTRLRDHITRYRASILKVGGRPFISIEDHKKMITYLKKRDRRQLKRIIQEHIETGKKVLLKGDGRER